MAANMASENLPVEANPVLRSNTERIAALEAILPTLATKADIERLKTDIEKLKSDLTWRLIIAMSILTAIFVAVIELRGA